MSAVTAEMLKIRTTKSWWGILLGGVIWVGLWTLGTAAFTGQSLDPEFPAPTPEDPDIARGVYTTGLTIFGYVFTMVLGVLAIGTEYRHKTVTPTFLATPRRWVAVISKWVATSAYSLLYGIVFLAVSVGIAVVTFSIRGFDIDLAHAELWRALGLCLLAFVLWGLIGMGIGTLVGNQIVAILLGVGFIVVEQIASGILLFVEWGPEVLRYFPSSATSALISPEVPDTGQPTVELLAWWTGALELVGIAAVFSLIGAALTLRRDVT